MRAGEIDEDGMNLGSSSHCKGQRPQLSATCWGRSDWLKSRRLPFSLPYSVNWLTRRTSPPMSTMLRSHARLPSSDGHSRALKILRHLHATAQCELGLPGEHESNRQGGSSHMYSTASALSDVARPTRQSSPLSIREISSPSTCSMSTHVKRRGRAWAQGFCTR